MPIVVRRGRVTAEPRSRLLRFERPSVTPTVASTVGNDLPAPDPRHELARLALDLVVRTAEPVELPARWSTYAFGREVERTRGQLVPIRSRAALIASFSREASISAMRETTPTGQPAGPVRVAYAIRWLELGDRRSRPAWGSIIEGTRDVVADALRIPAGAIIAAEDRPREASA